MTDPAGELEALAAAIGEAAALAGRPGARVAGLKRLSGGASKESWAFDLAAPDGGVEPMVLRRQPAEARFSHKVAGSLATEAALLRAVAAQQVPAPQVFFELPAGSPAGEGYAMARIEGETVGARILKDPALAEARGRMARQCGKILARIHAVPRGDLPELLDMGAKEDLDALRRRHVATGQQRPVFEFALRWLDEHLPQERCRTLVHGDFRNGNLVVGADGVRAVLDWELAHVGAPASDLGWLCVNSWRFQAPHNPVGGFGSREDLLEGYRSAGGKAVDPAELHAWEVFQTLAWGVMCAEVGQTFLEGVRSVEGAMIARRASETEFDLLRLLLPEHEAWNAG
jgi:aminoglycoside phosphotransferase (APT) family kinase protein